MRYDICCSLDRGEKINIEVQLVNHYDMNKRAVMYWSRLHTSSAAKGKQYKETTPSITFNILNFVLFHHHLRPFSRYVALDLESLLYHDCDPTIRLSDDFCICFLELPKFKFSEHKKLSKQEKWLAFLSDDLTFSQKEALAMDDISIKEACEGVKSFLSNQGRYLAYLDEEMCRMDREAQITSAFQDGKEEGLQEGLQRGMKQGLQRGMQQGLQQGIEQKRQQIVLKLLESGVDLKFIKTITGSTDEEIREIAMKHDIKI